MIFTNTQNVFCCAICYLLMPLPLLEFLKQGDSACCHCYYVFHDLSNFSANCEPDASNGFPQLTTNSPARDTVMEPELQRRCCYLSFMLSPGSYVGMHRFDLQDKHQNRQIHGHLQNPTLDDCTIIGGWAW